MILGLALLAIAFLLLAALLAADPEAQDARERNREPIFWRYR